MYEKLFCIGFHKTATTSLQKALEILGRRCYGYDARLLESYCDGQLREVFEIIERFDAFRDWPWPLLYRELAEAVPNAGFIYTVREPDSWISSLKRHAEKTGPTLARRIVYGEDMPHGHEERYIHIYTQHRDQVMDFFAGRSNFLRLCVEDGLTYPSLCQFLGVPEVAGNFPHLYKTAPD